MTPPPPDQSWPLPGREPELHRLHGLLDAADAGVPQFALVEGAPGIGKTALVEAFLARRTAPHLVVGLRPSDHRSPGAVAQRFLAAVTGRRDAPWPRSVEEGVQDVFAALQSLSAAQQGGASVLVLEDLHWCDPLSAEVLWRCALGRVTGAFLFVLTYRPHESTLTAEVEQLLRGGRRGALLRPGPLEADDCRRVLGDRLGIPVSEESARRVHAGTGGIPLLLDTVVRWLDDAPPEHRRLPEALAALGEGPEAEARLFTHALDSRLAALDPHARDAVDLLAIAGSPLHIIQLSDALTTLGHAGVPDHRQLESSGVEVFPLHGTVGWTHPHLAGLVAHRLPAQRQARLHRVLAGVLNGSSGLDHRVAAHRLDPDAAETPALVESLMTSGGEALQRRDGASAFADFHRALMLGGDPSALVMALRSCVLARRPDLVLDLRQELTGMPESRAVRAARAWELLAEEDLDGAVDQVRRGLMLSEEEPTRPGLLLLGHALAAAGRVAYATARFDAASGLMDDLLAELEPVRRGFEVMADRDPRALALVGEARSVEALLALWSGLRHGDRARVGQFTAQMQTLLRDLIVVPGTDAVRTAISSVVGSRLRAQGEVATAQRLVDTALQGEPGTRDQQAFLETTLSQLAFHRGEWDRALEHATRAMDQCLLLPPDSGVRAAYATAALVPLSRGEEQPAGRLLQRAEEGAGPTGDVVTCAVAYTRALGAVFADDHEEAVRQFRTMESTRVGWATAGFTTVCLYARSLAETGQVGELRRLAAEPTAGMASAPDGVLAAIRAAVLGALHRAQGEPGPAARQLTAAVAALDAEPVPYVIGIGPTAPPGGGHALTRAFLALDLARLGGAADAPGDIIDTDVDEAPGAGGCRAREAADVFLRCGAADLHRQAEALVTDAPALRPGTAPVSAGFRLLARLSTRERQIAVEASKGKDAREIATELFLNVLEVEHHMTRCLRTLGLRDRDELRAALRPATLSMLLPATPGGIPPEDDAGPVP